jgi:salicylate hydroxylase
MTGILGLAAASAMVPMLSADFNVNCQVFEKSRFKNEIGAAINVCPNATRLLTSYGFDFARTGSVPVEQVGTSFVRSSSSGSLKAITFSA